MMLRTIALFPFLFALGCAAQAPTTPPPTPGQPPKVSIVSPKKQALVRSIHQPGTVRADEMVSLFPRVGGFVEKVTVDIGDIVKSGDLLAEIAVPELVEESKEKQSLVKQAIIEIELAKKSFTISESNVVVAESIVAESKAGVKRAIATETRWASELKRMTALQKNNSIDAQVVDETTNQAQSAIASREEAQAKVVSSEAMLARVRAEREKADASVRFAEAKLEVSKAELGRVEVMVQFAKVRAPFDGIIVKRSLDIGHLTRPDAKDSLFVLAQVKRVRIVIDVPESDAGYVTPGVRVKVFTPSSSKIGPIDLTVSRTAGTLDPDNRTLRAEIDVENLEWKLLPGMYVTSMISVELPTTFVLPTSAVVKTADGWACYRVEDGKAIRVPIEVGATIGEWVQVRKINKVDATGDEKIATPAASLTDGMMIELAK